nr:hypothetical protein CFP56_42251 [Quercus suber]
MTLSRFPTTASQLQNYGGAYIDMTLRMPDHSWYQKTRPIEKFAEATAKCGPQGAAYGQCVAANYKDVHKDMCAKEFAAFKDCYLVSRYRSWVMMFTRTCAPKSSQHSKTATCAGEASIIRSTLCRCRIRTMKSKSLATFSFLMLHERDRVTRSLDQPFSILPKPRNGFVEATWMKAKQQFCSLVDKFAPRTQGVCQWCGVYDALRPITWTVSTRRADCRRPC